MAGAARSLPIGERIGDYEILGVAGAGGMGVVYKALDRKLERTVALKFLPHDLTVSEKDKARFVQEAKAASGLDHTNIGVIYSLEQMDDGQSFIVMAYYDGQTLAEKIRNGPLPAEAATNIAIQVARGLAEAHKRHIVHRDIKPSNVLVTREGVAKVVDFGLAQVLASPSATRSIGTSGTVAYMSPEQARGEAVDGRTDIWSLGVVLAEMLTGEHPFKRDNLASVIYAVIHQAPAAMEGVTPELQKIVYRALSKDPTTRYRNSKEMLWDLERLQVKVDATTRSIRPEEFATYVEHASGMSAAAPKRNRMGLVVAALAVPVLAALLLLVPSVRQRMAVALSGTGETERHIAVLPFDNLGGEAANPAVAEGLVDSLTGKLSNLDVGNKSLWVVPASEVRRRKVEDPGTALRELGATLVVKGSMVQSGKDVQLTLNLINARDMRQIGSVEVRDRTGDLAALQNDAVAKLARLMNLAVTPEMLRDTGGAVTPAAYEDYLKALGYLHRYDKPENVDQAIETLRGAVEADPRFALGYAQLGEAYRLKHQLDQNPKWIEEASANCKRAVELNDRLPAAYVTLGRLHSRLGKDDLALQEFQHALDLNPRDADAQLGVGRAYERMGRTKEAEATFQRAAALRPDYWDGYNELGNFYGRTGKYQEAIAAYRRVLELTPDNAQAYSNLASVYLDMGDEKGLPEAEKNLKKAVELSPSYAAYANLGVLYLSKNRLAESAEMTEKALAINDQDFRLWANLALTYTWLKQEDKARKASDRQMQLMEQQVKLQPSDATLQAALGVLYAERKQRDKALPRMRAALALAPDDPRILVDVGEAYEDLGDRREAIQLIGRAVAKGHPMEELKNRAALQELLADADFRAKVKQ